MAANVYLVSLQETYEGLRKSIAGLQARAAEAKRELTSEELRSVTEQGQKAEALWSQIEDLGAIELRNAQVDALAAKVGAALAPASSASSASSAGDAGVSLGGARTQARDPGFYTRSSTYSFLGDQYRAAQLRDTAAAQRLADHSNALRDDEHLRDVLGSGGGVGLVPPVWLAEQFAPILHRRLRVASVLRQVPWAGPFAWSIPVAGTAATTESVAEGVNPAESSPTYSVSTVTPQAISGFSEVSRQMLEASNPAVDAIIWGDLLGDFYDDAEALTVTALEAQAGVNLVTIADGAVLPGARDGVLDAIAAISDGGAGDATVFVGRTARWTRYLKLADTTNRPLIVSQRHVPQNVNGVGDALGTWSNVVQGDLEGLAVVTTPSVGVSRAFVINAEQILFSVSPPTQFQFEQPAGPALVRVGVWGYAAISTARYPKAITKITYTAN